LAATRPQSGDKANAIYVVSLSRCVVACCSYICKLSRRKSDRYPRIITAVCGSQNDIERAFCLGYVSGVARQVKWNGLAYKDLTNLHDATIIAFMAACPSTVVSDEATLQVFKDWAKNHSDQGGSDAQLGVMNALVAMWPCKQQSK